jgi:hypothetical protein
MIEIKTFLYLLLTNFTFQPTEDKILKKNVYVTFLANSQNPLTVF